MDNIKTDIGDIVWGDVDSIILAEDRGKWRALVNAVMKHKMLGSNTTGGLSISALLKRIG
jgi:hypothetical protein